MVVRIKVRKVRLIPRSGIGKLSMAGRYQVLFLSSSIAMTSEVPIGASSIMVNSSSIYC